MSNLWITRVRKHSPYTKTAKLIHLIMADCAGPDGDHFVHQQTLAEECGCTVGYVEQVVARMKRDGMLVTTRIGYRTIYILQDPTPVGLRTPLQSGFQPHSSVVETHTPVGLHKEPPTNPQRTLKEPASKRPRACGASGEEGDVIPGQLDPDDQASVPLEPRPAQARGVETQGADENHSHLTLTHGRRRSVKSNAGRAESNGSVGSLPPEPNPVGGLPPEPNPTETEASSIVRRISRGTTARAKPKPGTQAAVIAYFSQASRESGHVDYNLKGLVRVINRLRTEFGYDYEEIEVLMRKFFHQHRPEARSTKTNIVWRFADALPVLMKKTKVRIESDRAGSVQNSGAITDMSAEIAEWKASQNA